MKSRSIYFLLFLPLFGCDRIRPSKIIEKAIAEEMARQETPVDDYEIFTISLTQDSLNVKYHRNNIQLKDLNELDIVIKQDSIQSKNKQVALKALADVPYEKVKEVMDVLTKNNIYKFNLVSEIVADKK